MAKIDGVKHMPRTAKWRINDNKNKRRVNIPLELLDFKIPTVTVVHLTNVISQKESV